jgi:hypothetical protein
MGEEERTPAEIEPSFAQIRKLLDKRWYREDISPIDGTKSACSQQLV